MKILELTILSPGQSTVSVVYIAVDSVTFYFICSAFCMCTYNIHTYEVEWNAYFAVKKCV